MLPPIMAVNGPPNGEVELHLPISPDPSSYYPHPSPPSPLLGGKSSPPPPPPDPPGPVSPGKKRVRISDSTSVRVIEDVPPRTPHRPVASAQHRTYYQQFNSDFHHSRLQQPDTPSPRSRRPPRHASPHEDDRPVGRKEVREDRVGSGEEGVRELQAKEYEQDYPYPRDDSGVDVPEEYGKEDSLNKEEEQLAASEEESSSTGVPSLESRDNPFLPGGDLSREAEDLLSKATIVRDKFYLDQQRQGATSPATTATTQDPNLNPSATHPAAGDVADGALPNDSKRPAAEDRITPTSAANAEAARPDSSSHTRENGKASGDGVSSPDGVRVEVGAAEGSKGAGASDSEGEDKDKAKRRPKCCLVM